MSSALGRPAPISAGTTIAVVGGGASGVLVAAHLAAAATDDLAAAAAHHPNPEILLIDPQLPGRGVAYGTSDPRHRLNVPAKAMSAWPDDPSHFLRWLRRHVDADFPDGGFAARRYYAQYLAEVLDAAATANPAVTIRHLARRVTDLRSGTDGVEVQFDDGTLRTVDAAVLATGYGPPCDGWAPAELRRAPQFVADPWAVAPPRSAPEAAEAAEAADAQDIVIVGAGLTAVDMAQTWARAGVRLHVVSRHGQLPLAHSGNPQPPIPSVPDAAPATLAGARRLVFAAIRAAGGDWRRAVDGLRPVTAELWRGLDVAERAAFLRGPLRRWDRVRHRLAPDVAAWLDQRRADGSLVVHAACVVAAEPTGRTVRLTLADGTVIDAAVVLNCTGALTDQRRSADPLAMNLLDRGVAQPGPLDLGYATDEDGRLRPASGTAPAVWTIGPLRRGELWESTAIPEIRVQAATLARSILAALPAQGDSRSDRMESADAPALTQVS